nr:MAG TPA: hypothetical protein [Caudoviricetes sp.]
MNGGYFRIDHSAISEIPSDAPWDRSSMLNDLSHRNNYRIIQKRLTIINIWASAQDRL